MHNQMPYHVQLLGASEPFCCQYRYAPEYVHERATSRSVFGKVGMMLVDREASLAKESCSQSSKVPILETERMRERRLSAIPLLTPSSL